MVQIERAHACRSELGDLRTLAHGVERQPFADSHGCVLPARHVVAGTRAQREELRKSAPLACYAYGTAQEGAMKHKGERHIPDFSKKTKPSHAIVPDRKAPMPPQARAPQPKPQATSVKSGRRGQ